MWARNLLLSRPLGEGRKGGPDHLSCIREQTEILAQRGSGLSLKEFQPSLSQNPKQANEQKLGYFKYKT